MNSDATGIKIQIRLFSLWVRTMTWTAFSIFLLLRPNGSTGTSDRVLELRWYSIGGVLESIGHTIFFTILTRLWIRTLANYVPQRYVLWLTVGFATLLGVSTEIIQYFMATRAASVLDLAANLLGVFFAVVSSRKILNQKDQFTHQAAKTNKAKH